MYAVFFGMIVIPSIPKVIVLVLCASWNICIQSGLYDMEAMVEFWIIGCIVVMLVVGCHFFFL